MSLPCDLGCNTVTRVICHQTRAVLAPKGLRFLKHMTSQRVDSIPSQDDPHGGSMDAENLSQLIHGLAAQARLGHLFDLSLSESSNLTMGNRLS